MKTILYTSLLLILVYNTSSGQCTDGGLKVQSNTCEAPQNLSILSLNCTELKLGWMGSKSQGYIVKATLRDSAKGTTVVNERQIVTDKAGNGETAIKVGQGVQVHWSVQAVCSGETYKMYSKEVAGVDTITPSCPTLAATATLPKLVAYPNPAKDYLMIAYQPSVAGSATFEVYNMEGKKLMSQTQSAVAERKNSYRLNITALRPGSYLLKASSSKEGTHEVKFVKAEM